MSKTGPLIAVWTGVVMGGMHFSEAVRSMLVDSAIDVLHSHIYNDK
jgi:hypothetical protein